MRSTNQELNAFIRAIEQLKQKYEPHCLKYGGQKAADEFRVITKKTILIIRLRNLFTGCFDWSWKMPKHSSN